MAIGDYVKTIYVSNSAPGISAERLNNNENKTAELDAAFAGLLPPGIICMWSGSAANIPTGWRLCDGTNGTPDLRGKFILGAGGSYGPGDTGGEEEHTLTEAEMPSHDHDVSVTGGSHSHTASSGNAGNHSHTGTAASAGAHFHSYYDVQFPAQVGTVVTFNLTGADVRVLDNLRATEQAGAHTHSISTGTAGSHNHPITVSSAGHSHNASAANAGQGQAHNNMPPYFALCYIMKS